MNKSRSSSFRASAASAALIAGGLLATTALATTSNPQPLTAGSTVSVPEYGPGASNLVSSVTGTGLAYCIESGCNTGQLSLFQIASDLDGGFVEVAGTTNLNPFGSNDLTFAIVSGLPQAVASVELPDFSTWLTDVQACTPNIAIPCPSTDSGANAMRDSAGNVWFSATSASGFPMQTIDGIPVTDVYAIYTNAPVSALTDPNLTFTYVSGSTVTFDGLGLKAPSTGTVPEPSALALLAAGLAALGLGMSLRRRLWF